MAANLQPPYPGVGVPPALVGPAFALGRKAAGVSTGLLAREAGLSRFHLARVEAGTEPTTPATVSALYAALGVLAAAALAAAETPEVRARREMTAPARRMLAERKASRERVGAA